MLKLKNVSKYYYQDGVIAEGFVKANLELHLGEFVVITGESGSGKSTLLNVLSGLDSYEDGEMYINGEETSHYTEEDYLEYRRRYVSNIFQNFNLVNSYTVYENIELTMLMNGKNRSEIKKYINELINKVGLTKYRNTKTSKLSGGQKQRVAIARALANDTPIIVADEPTGALDSVSSKIILKLLHEISKEKLVIVVTHQKDEIEKYATRLIRMHDGKILENKIVKEINLDEQIESKKIRNITTFSNIRLGMRNAFNIPIKFVLMFIIFLLITVTLLTNYASFKIAETEELGYSYNNFFYNDANERIIITKKDKTIFTKEDYDKIKELDNIDYIMEYDLLTDSEIDLEGSDLYLYGKLNPHVVSKVDIGRLPENINELVLIGNPNNWMIDDYLEDILNTSFRLNGNYSNNIKVVGIVFNNDYNEYELEFYATNDFLDKLVTYYAKDNTNVTFAINNYYFSSKSGRYLDVIMSDNLKDGEVYVKDDFNMYCAYYNCLNKEITINAKNIYYEDTLTLKITKVFTKDNASKLLGIKYDEVYDTIFISRSDYDKLFNKGNYQSSVFVKELKDLDKTADSLNGLGFNTLKMRDAKHNDAEVITQIFKILKLIVVLVLVFGLFFISYFIMKVIYKSRNSYYTTLRTLGSTKKVCINILMNELITLSLVTYTLFLIFICLIKRNIIKVEYFVTLAKYVEVIDYVIVYLILLVLSILMAYRYGRKIFKNSIIKTYGERI